VIGTVSVMVTNTPSHAAAASLAHRVRGEGAPVLFIQGVGVHGDAWAPQVDALASGYRCLTFDNRGIGGSPLDGALSVARMTDDALKLMDAQGWEAAHVVGHSMGGLLALSLALTAPVRVRSLALVCSFATGREVTRPSPAMICLGLRSRVASASAST
jgi:pimeloyl-ACP methyl ester carboxylesterase